jgi:hypothetical protein
MRAVRRSALRFVACTHNNSLIYFWYLRFWIRAKSYIVWCPVFNFPGTEGELHALQVGDVRRFRFCEGPNLLRRMYGFPQPQHHPQNDPRDKPETGPLNNRVVTKFDRLAQGGR